MDINKIVELKTVKNGATVYYNNHEVWINRIDLDTGIVDVLDLITGESLSLHSNKLHENYNEDSNYFS